MDLTMPVVVPFPCFPIRGFVEYSRLFVLAFRFVFSFFHVACVLSMLCCFLSTFPNGFWLAVRVSFVSSLMFTTHLFVCALVTCVHTFRSFAALSISPRKTLCMSCNR